MGIYFSISGLIFLIIIMINYFFKKKVKTLDTEIYKFLIILTFIGVSLDIISSFLYNMGFDYTNFVYILISKLIFIYFVFWVALFCYYIKCICNPQKSNDKKYLKLSLKKFLIISTVISVLIIILPLHFIIVSEIIIPQGTSVLLTYFISFVYIIYSLCLAIKNRKKIVKLKLIPLYVFCFLMVMNFIIQFIFPQLFLINYLLCLVVIIMYHTIENPDVKMIEKLEIAKAQADKANLAKSDFLSSMSHEIRTPLNAIVGFSECILEENNLESAKEDAKDIVIASQNLLEIVNGILDISKIEADKMEIVETNYNPRENFENLAKLMVPRIGEKPIILNTKLPEDLPGTLYGDCGKVKQIVTNILTNAVKYTEKGEINFEVNCINNNNECSLVISVEDTGRGIQDDKIESLFAKFERLDEDKNTTTEGTGLGLAITKKLTEMLGGTIVVQSKYGEGSKFTVYLKQQIVSLNEDITKAKETNDNIKIDYSSKKVLIVDDNNINIKVAERLLREYNLNIESVISGFECLDKIKKGIKYDLILLDDMMPKMSGVETLHELKKIDDFNTPTIALTANALSGMREKYLEEGFNDYLSKPIEKLELKRVLETYLSDGTTNDTNKNDTKKESTVETLELKENNDSNNNNNNDEDILVQNGIDINKGLELLGDIELYNETFNDFINGIHERLEKLEEYKNSNDMPNYAILAHATKSDSKYLGCTKLAEIALNHELKSKENDSEYVNNNYDEFIFEINKVIETGKRYLNKDE